MDCSDCINFIYRGECFCQMKKFENIPLNIAKNFKPIDFNCYFFDSYDDPFVLETFSIFTNNL